ncbi:hypothetical protein L249_4297 [Ophiocordyceps polyrhachis-furcata BCC 54312]|uniref:Phytase A n=1 Tax=Ophiocordyceps polyrhachis-furcata BCC 54312 TaxID=1330021 RepID=A0A367L7H4_9HYPO|nr:hypothetical protein L249_4297 [Ophiocordyceps polyrhachis-furcata BCC 54312]
MLVTLMALVAVLGQKLLGPTSSSAPTQKPDWGQYTPFTSIPSEISASTPRGCKLTFGLVLSRHGARYATRGMAEGEYQPLFGKIRSSVSEFGRGFEFLREYEPALQTDRLTVLGQREMVDSGRAFFRRYRRLGSGLFVRASGSERVVMSARNFTSGFFGKSMMKIAEGDDDFLVIPEREGFNNTLDHQGCTAFEQGPAADLGSSMRMPWLEIWAAPIRERLNRNLRGANLSLIETVYFMDQCPFNSVIDPDAPPSEFCSLFSPEEWHGYGYYQSLGKWYGYGNGNPLGPTQGVGYVNELVARLTGRPVRDHTTTNSTLDSDPKTFPLDRALYADFSHDNTMMSVYAALGLYNATGELPLTRRLSPDDAHGYSTAWAVPFAGRMYVEKMSCGSGGGGGDELVRILVNDRVIPLQGCGADQLGRCSLAAFVDSLAFARNGGRWRACFAEA